MKHFVAITLTGDIVLGSGDTVSEALGSPAGLDYYLEAKNRLLCDVVKIGNKFTDITAHYATDTTTKPYTFVLAHVSPLCNKYRSIFGTRYSTREDIVEAVKSLRD